MSDLTKPSVIPDDAEEKGEGWHKHGERGHYHPMTGPQPHTHGVEIPSHESEVRRGAGMTITNHTPDEDRVIDRLATALGDEFTFYEASEGSWRLAAAGILRKMRAEVTSVDGGVAIVHIPLTN